MRAIRETVTVVHQRNVLRVLSRLILPVLVILLSGCSAFRGATRIDMQPFSDNARILFGDAVIVSRPFQMKHLRPYASIPEYQQLVEKGRPLKEALKRVVYYSNQVVAINNSSLSDSEKNHQLAIYLSEAMEAAIENQHAGSLRLDKNAAQESLANIRNATTYLDGVAAATPIVNSVVLAIHDRLDELQDLMPTVIVAFNREIDLEFGATRANFLRLTEVQERLMRSTSQLYAARIGDKSELDVVILENGSMREFFSSAEKATPDQLAAAEEFLLEQLRNVDTMLHQLDEAKAEYLAKQNELIQWQTHVDDRIMVARNSVTVWAQSHRNLGDGIPVPPLIDISAIALGLANKASKSVVP